MVRETVGTVEEFPEGQAHRVDVDGIPIALVNIEGEFFAIQNTCIHKNLPLHPIGSPRLESEELQADERAALEDCGCSAAEIEERTKARTRGRINEEDCTIHCPWHYLEWDLETGENPVTQRRIATFTVVVEDEDVVVEL